MRRLGIVVAALLVGLLICQAHAEPQEKYPGEWTGVPRPGEWDKANWTTSQHAWYILHQLSDALLPALAVGAAGAGGAIWRKRRSS